MVAAVAGRGRPRGLGRTGRLAAVTAPALAAATLAVWDPTRNGGPSLCVFRACTGVACPTCGLTRASASLLRGRWHEAVSLHPLAPLLLAQAVILWVLLATARRPIGPRWRAVAGALATVNAVALVVVWAVRLSSGSIDIVS